MALFDRLVALAPKEHHDFEENFWERGSYGAVALLDEDAVHSKTVYTLNNPVATGLVRYSKDWPGLVTRPDARVRAPIPVDRPKVCLRDRGSMPKHTESLDAREN